MKTGKIIEIHQQKELTQGKFEGATIHEAFLDNGDQGEIFVMKGQQPPAKDSDISYTLEETDYGNKIKIARPNTGGGFRGGKSDPVKNESIERQASMKAAVELAGYWINNGSKVTTNDIVTWATVFAQFVKGVQAKSTQPENNQKTGIPGVTTTDEPPF